MPQPKAQKISGEQFAILLRGVLPMADGIPDGAAQLRPKLLLGTLEALDRAEPKPSKKNITSALKSILGIIEQTFKEQPEGTTLGSSLEAAREKLLPQVDQQLSMEEKTLRELAVKVLALAPSMGEIERAANEEEHKEVISICKELLSRSIEGELISASLFDRIDGFVERTYTSKKRQNDASINERGMAGAMQVAEKSRTAKKENDGEKPSFFERVFNMLLSRLGGITHVYAKIKPLIIDGRVINARALSNIENLKNSLIESVAPIPAAKTILNVKMILKNVAAALSKRWPNLALTNAMLPGVGEMKPDEVEAYTREMLAEPGVLKAFSRAQSIVGKQLPVERLTQEQQLFALNAMECFLKEWQMRYRAFPEQLGDASEGLSEGVMSAAFAHKMEATLTVTEQKFGIELKDKLEGLVLTGEAGENGEERVRTEFFNEQIINARLQTIRQAIDVLRKKVPEYKLIDVTEEEVKADICLKENTEMPRKEKKENVVKGESSVAEEQLHQKEKVSSLVSDLVATRAVSDVPKAPEEPVAIVREKARTDLQPVQLIREAKETVEGRTKAIDDKIKELTDDASKADEHISSINAVLKRAEMPLLERAKEALQMGIGALRAEWYRFRLPKYKSEDVRGIVSSFVEKYDEYKKARDTVEVEYRKVLEELRQAARKRAPFARFTITPSRRKAIETLKDKEHSLIEEATGLHKQLDNACTRKRELERQAACLDRLHQSARDETGADKVVGLGEKCEELKKLSTAEDIDYVLFDQQSEKVTASLKEFARRKTEFSKLDLDAKLKELGLFDDVEVYDVVELIRQRVDALKLMVPGEQSEKANREFDARARAVNSLLSKTLREACRLKVERSEYQALYSVHTLWSELTKIQKKLEEAQRAAAPLVVNETLESDIAKNLKEEEQLLLQRVDSLEKLEGRARRLAFVEGTSDEKLMEETEKLKAELAQQLESIEKTKREIVEAAEFDELNERQSRLEERIKMASMDSEIRTSLPAELSKLRGQIEKYTGEKKNQLWSQEIFIGNDQYVALLEKIDAAFKGKDIFGSIDALSQVEQELLNRNAQLQAADAGLYSQCLQQVQQKIAKKEGEILGIARHSEDSELRDRAIEYVTEKMMKSRLFRAFGDHKFEQHELREAARLTILGVDVSEPETAGAGAIMESEMKEIEEAAGKEAEPKNEEKITLHLVADESRDSKADIIARAVTMLSERGIVDQFARATHNVDEKIELKEHKIANATRELSGIAVNIGECISEANAALQDFLQHKFSQKVRECAGTLDRTKAVGVPGLNEVSPSLQKQEQPYKSH